MNTPSLTINHTGLRTTTAPSAPRPTKTAQDERKQISLGAAIALILVVAVNLRPSLVSIGPVLTQLREEFHLTNAQASLLISVPTLLMGILAVPTPWLAQRWGRNPVIIGALVLLALSTMLRSLSTSGAVLLLATAGAGAGIAVAGALISGFVKAHHPTRAALLMGLYAASLGLGSSIAALFTGPLTHLTGSWRSATALWSLPVVGAVAAWVYVLRTESAQQLNQPVVAASHYAHPIKSRMAWLVATYFAANNFLFCSVLTWIVAISEERGLSAIHAGPMLAVFTTVFMLANPIPGLLGKGTDRRKAIAFFALAFLVGVTLLLEGTSDYLWLPIGLIGFGVGGTFSLGMMLPLDNTTDPSEANLWTSFSLAIGYGVGALGPLVLGHLRDASENFQSGLWVLVGVGLLELTLAPFLFKKKLLGKAQR